MKRLLSLVALGASAALLRCTSPEPVGIDGSVAAAAPKQVIVSPSAATLSVGQTQQFSAQLIQDGKQKKAAFTWSSSNSGVATVSAAGLVTATGGGDATITATTSTGPSGTAHVTVAQSAPTIVATLPLGGSAFGSAVSSNGIGWVGQLNNGTAQRLDVAGAQFTGSASTGGGLPVQVYPKADGSRVYVANFGGVVASINTSTLATEQTAVVPGDAYAVTTRGGGGDTVIVGITDGPLFEVDLGSGTIQRSLNLPTAAGYHFEWNANRTLLYAAARGFDGGRVYEINPFTFQVVRTFETGGSPQGIALSADGTKLYIAAEAGDIIVWDVASNTQAGTIATGVSGYGLVRLPNNSLVVGSVFQGVVVVVNATTGSIIATLNTGGRVRELSYDPGTGSVIAPNESGWVDIIR